MKPDRPNKVGVSTKVYWLSQLGQKHCVLSLPTEAMAVPLFLLGVVLVEALDLTYITTMGDKYNP